MKASITDKGVLIVTPETPLETFALGKWGEIAFCGTHQVTNIDQTVGETFTLLRGANLIVGPQPAA